MKKRSEAVSSDPQPELMSDVVAADYSPLDFNEVFVAPAGPKGLQYTDRIKALDGRKVAMTGFMVKNYGPDPSVFVFSNVPRIHNEREEGLADSLPPSLLHVIMQVRPGDAPAWRREKLTVYGKLELGAHQELNGRISHLRLRCDWITEATTGRIMEVRKPLVLQRNRIAPDADRDAAAQVNGGSPIFFNPRRNPNPTPTAPSR